MTRRKPPVGTVVQLRLPDGRYAYGRVLRDASVAFYKETSLGPDEPPLGARDYQFVVGVYEDVLRSDQVAVVGTDPARDSDDDWPPPMRIEDPITGAKQIYHKGLIRAATDEECRGLEPAAVWDLSHLIDRLARS